MIIEVEVNGVIHEFPAGTSRDVMRSALQRLYAKNTVAQQSVQEQPIRGDGVDGGDGRAFAYGLSGGQIPFGNVITSGIGAGIARAASPFTGDPRTFGQLYEQAQADTKATQEASPTATMLGNLAGIATTLPAAFSKPVQGAGILATPAKGVQDIGTALGKVAGATPFKGTGMLSGAGNLGARMAGGAAVAAPIGGLYAAGEADAGQRGDAFLEGARTAAAFGAALPVAGAVLGAAGKAVTPSIEEAAKESAQILNSLAKKHKIPLSVDDVVGDEFYNRLVTQGEKLPFSGAKKSAETKQIAINRAVSRTLGEESDKITPEYLNKVRKSLGNDFEAFTKDKVFTPNIDFYTKLDEIVNSASRGNYGLEGIEFLNKYKSAVENLIDPATGIIKGDRLDKLRRDFSKTSRVQGQSNVGRLADDFEDLVVNIISDSDPNIARSISDTKYKYKNYKTVIGIAKKEQNTGDINPALLANRVSQKFGEDAFATGRAGDLGEIARIGQALRMPSTSGTAENIISNALLTGGAGVAYGALGAPGVAGITAGVVGNRMLQGYNRNPENVNRLIQGATNLPALQSVSRSALPSGMLGGYIGSQ